MANEGAGMEVHQTLLKERGASSSIRGGGTLGGEEEGGAVNFFQESESFIMIIVCLVGFYCQYLTRPRRRANSLNLNFSQD